MYLQKTHIHFCVDDAAQSAAFYEALLGAPPAHRSEIAAIFDVDSPPLVLTIEQRRAPRPPKGRRARARRELTLVVTEPRHVGVAAIALRRAGVQLRLEDSAIEAEDPDGNAWKVRFVESAPGKAVVTT